MKKNTKIIIWVAVILVFIVIVLLSTLLPKNNAKSGSKNGTGTTGTNSTTTGTAVASIDNDYIKITYESTSKVYKIDGTEHTITVNQDFPTVRADDSNVQNVLQEELGVVANSLFDEYKKKVESRLSGYTGEVMNNLGDLSISWNLANDRNDSKVVSVKAVSSGNLASVSMNNQRGYSFDATTGKRLTVDQIANQKEAFRKYVNDTTKKYLKLNSQKLGLQSSKVSNLDNLINIDNLNWYLSRSGLTICFEQNDLSYNAFVYTIPYYSLEGLIKSDYL